MQCASRDRRRRGRGRRLITVACSAGPRRERAAAPRVVDGPPRRRPSAQGKHSRPWRSWRTRTASSPHMSPDATCQYRSRSHSGPGAVRAADIAASDSQTYVSSAPNSMDAILHLCADMTQPFRPWACASQSLAAAARLPRKLHGSLIWAAWCRTSCASPASSWQLAAPVTRTTGPRRAPSALTPSESGLASSRYPRQNPRQRPNR